MLFDLSKLFIQFLLGRQNTTWLFPINGGRRIRGFLRAPSTGVYRQGSPPDQAADSEVLRAFHHGICKSAFILALTCIMTSVLTVAFFLARRIFQSRDFT